MHVPSIQRTSALAASATLLASLVKPFLMSAAVGLLTTSDATSSKPTCALQLQSISAKQGCLWLEALLDVRSCGAAHYLQRHSRNPACDASPVQMLQGVASSRGTGICHFKRLSHSAAVRLLTTSKRASRPTHAASPYQCCSVSHQDM